MATLLNSSQTRSSALYLYWFHGQQLVQEQPFLPLFGYCSRSLPGIEFAVKHRQAKLLKEKIIYLLKIWGIRLPAKRFVLSLDGARIEQLDLSYAELPFLLLLLGLGGLIPWSYEQESFVVNGKITLGGALELSTSYLNYLVAEQRQPQWESRKLTYLLSETQELPSLPLPDHSVMNLELLLKSFR